MRPKEPPQNLKLGSRDSLQSLKVGTPRLYYSFMNSVFQNILPFFFLIWFLLFLDNTQNKYQLWLTTSNGQHLR